MFKKFSQWFDDPPPSIAPENHICDAQGCNKEGIYRAPKSRYHLEKSMNEWYWLCLQHVRQYNQSWNYYVHMSEGEIVQERQKDLVWDRPSWTVSHSSSKTWFHETIKDPFGFFATGAISSPETVSEQGQALALLQLTMPFTLNELRTNYRMLVKKYHPDMNQQTLEAEEMIRKLNQAYAYLQKMITVPLTNTVE